MLERLRELFLLQGPSARVRRRSPSQDQAIRQYAQQARQIVAAARSHDLESALILYRDAVVFLMAAALVEQDSDAPVRTLTRAQIWERWRALPTDSCHEADLLLKHKELLTTDHPLSFLPPETPAAQSQLAGEMDCAAAWLLRSLETRSIKYLKASRAFRIGVPIALCVVLLVKLVGLIAAPRNIAKHRPVLMSSVHPASISAAGDLTNGRLESTYGAHTNGESSPWVMVDLGSSQPIARVAIYNRGDGWFDESLPLVLELADQEHGPFTEIETRRTHFSQSEPWVVAGIHQSARFVRVRKTSNGNVVLSEIEVYQR